MSDENMSNDSKKPPTGLGGLSGADKNTREEGARMAAILMLSIGEENASALFSGMDDFEVSAKVCKDPNIIVNLMLTMLFKDQPAVVEVY